MDSATVIDAIAAAGQGAINIVPDVDGNGSHGTNGKVALSLLGKGRMFKRRAWKFFGTPNARLVEWLVVELDGVKVYANGVSIIVTRADLNP